MTTESRPTRARRCAVFGAGFLALIAALPLIVTSNGSAAEPAAATKPSHGPQLSIAEPVHDFGSIPQGKPVMCEFRLVNSGDELLEIHDVKPSCGCTTTGDWPHALKPGESGVIPIQLETAHFVGGITKNVTIKSNDPRHPEILLELKADVWTPVKISEPVLIFPAITNPNETARRSVTISNQVEGALNITDLHSDNPRFEAALKEVVPGKSFELTVTTVPPLPDGTQTGRITMKSSNPQMPELVVQAVETLLPAIQVAPTELMFANAKLTAPEKRFAVVLNHRGADLHVSELTTNAPGAEIASNMAPDGKQLTITILFPAGFEIHKTDRFSLRGKINQPSMPTFEIPIVYAGNR
jgi:hypothetical protein